PPLDRLHSLIVITPEGVIADATQLACEMLGRERDELVSMNIVEVARPVSANGGATIVERLASASSQYYGDIEALKPDGSVAELAISCTRLANGSYLCSLSVPGQAAREAPGAWEQLKQRWKAVSGFARRASERVSDYLDSTTAGSYALSVLEPAKPYLLFFAAHLIGALAYFLVRSDSGQNGWNIAPADDIWIGLTYARNFADTLVFSYNPGQSEAGMTSPLWVVLLGVLHTILQLDVPALAQLVGLLLATATSAFAYLIASRISGSALAGMAAGVIIALDPTFAFAKISGAEVALFAAVSLAATWALLTGRHTLAGILLGLVVLARPEGFLLVVAVLVAFTARRLWERADARFLLSDAQELVIIGAPSVLAIAAWVSYNLTATGLPLPNSYYVKHESLGLFSGGNLANIWTGYLRNTSYFASVQPIATLPLIGAGAYFALKRGGFHAVPFALFPVMLIYAFSILLPLPDGRWSIETRRYLDPILPHAIVMITLGLAFASQKMSGYIQSQRNLDAESLKSLWLTRQVAMAVLILFAFASIPFRWPSLAPEFSDNAANIAAGPAAIARWLDDNIPPEATIATAAPGALKFFTGHSLVDLTALNYHEGIGKDMFSIAEQAGTDYAVAFDTLYVRSWPYWNPIASVEIEDNTILDGARLAVYETLQDAPLAPRDMPLNVRLERLALVDSLDVGDATDELEHDWEMEPLDNTLSRAFRTNAATAISDHARVTSGRESFRVRAAPNRELIVVKRYDAGVRGVIEVFVNGEQVGVWRLAPRSYFFGEDQFFIPASYVQGDSVELAFEHVPDARGETSLNSFYYWFFAPAE
ncbi:MAG: hypothetical protein L0177_10150, partial [Chloroflexi bacterium]|nr:hypothetical protein [Chloroflexota bacterium]